MTTPAGSIPEVSTGWIVPLVRSLEIHDIILVVVLLILFSAAGGAPLLRLAFKKIAHLNNASTTINIGDKGAAVGNENPNTLPKECIRCGLMIDPTKCVMHQAEHERSIQNQKAIEQLWQSSSKLRDEMNSGFKEMRVTLLEGQTKILAALSTRPASWDERG